MAVVVVGSSPKVTTTSTRTTHRMKGTEPRTYQHVGQVVGTGLGTFGPGVRSIWLVHLDYHIIVTIIERCGCWYISMPFVNFVLLYLPA